MFLTNLLVENRNPDSSIASFVGLNSNGDEKEFDMFAQSRNVTYETSKQRYVC